MDIELDKINEYKKTLEHLASEAAACGELEHDLESPKHKELMNIYKIKSATGRVIYNSFSDEELCDYIRKRAKEIDHVPTQKEVYWIYHMYIKHRFGNWPKALKNAVMSTKAGSGGHSYKIIEEREKQCEEIFDKIRKKAEELKRPPHMGEMQDCIEGLKYKFDTWNQVLEAAGINQEWKNTHMLFRVEDFSEEEKLLLKKIKDRSVELGRPPLRKEIEEDVKETLKRKCKTWRNILYQIGMEPVEKSKPFAETYLDSRKDKGMRHRDILSNGLYKVFRLGKKEKEYLAEFKTIMETLNRAPIKEELPKEVYEGLMKACGSYRNVLFQLDAVPLEKTEEQRIRKRIKGGK
ncbi:homing endonuclease associated repeat-containing protein [Aminipila luticellarii]|uniref:Uncharacterized protein n=1 Tax=Aminipila luticellarii TaxID=2507160 RepID=A0A410PU58_9FIRM|nr:hypothetical protein [Aminipila luticellarii]QAT42487.1 hypothetical protein EQM06_04150 [Aminipila luticellarii]